MGEKATELPAVSAFGKERASAAGAARGGRAAGSAAARAGTCWGLPGLERRRQRTHGVLPWSELAPPKIAPFVDAHQLKPVERVLQNLHRRQDCVCSSSQDGKRPFSPFPRFTEAKFGPFSRHESIISNQRILFMIKFINPWPSYFNSLYFIIIA